MDSPVSESASTTAGGLVYTGGGIGTFSRFSRFDPVSGSHQDMPELPGPRHHPMMTSDGDVIYMAGGYSNRFGLENAENNFWRFDPDVGAWEILTDMPNVRAGGAAVYLHGHVWIVGGAGTGTDMQVYDIRTGEWELIPGAPVKFRDHLQAVAFENEIWWLAGRTISWDETTNKVVIWNPVTREWREGPAMNHARSGLAARVVQGQIMVVGGEVMNDHTAGLTLSTEVFAPGAHNWVFGPASPVPVHGTTGAAANGEFVLVGGSDIAAATSQNLATQVFTPAH
jgi:hypothetical protein